MPIEIPADWPPRAWAEDAPLAHLETIATDAPSGAVPRRWEIASWSSTREIASSALPGQVRHKTGLSVGTAKARVKRDSADYPWRRSDVYELTGSAAQILIAPEGATELPTGQFRVAPIEGDISTIGVDVDLDERQIQGQSKTANVLGEQLVSWRQMADSLVDPAWFISELAQQMGYGVTPEPGDSGYNPILDVPWQGSIAPAFPRGVEFFTNDVPAWEEFQGAIAVSTASDLSGVQCRYRLGTTITASVTVTVDAYGVFEFEWHHDDTSTTGLVSFLVQNGIGAQGGNPATEIFLQVGSIGANGTPNANASGTFNFPAVTDRPAGVQIQFEVTATGSNWTSARARVRRGLGSAWSAWVNHTITNTLPAGDAYAIWTGPDSFSPGTYGPGKAARLSVVDNAVSGGNTWTVDQLWSAQSPTQQGRLYLEPLVGTVQSPWLDPSLSVWGAMQAIVNAWQGALITDIYGDLRLLNRFSLTGVGTGTEMPIDIGVKFEDLPWVMEYADQADRLVVKYRPVVIRQWDDVSDDIPIIWELQEIKPMYPGDNDIFFTLDYIYPIDLKLIPFVRKDNSNGQFHEWDAHRYNNGTGAHITPGDQLQMRIDRVTSSTWKILVRNLTAPPAPFHMVDSAGTPWIKIRSSYYFDQTQEQVIERGLPSTEAENTLEIDLSNYVQNATDANAIADFVWGRVNQRTWRAKTVRSVPDYRLDLGDVVEITHERTGVRSNALVSKVELAGEPGSVTQQIDLILIPPTWEDFDEAWGPEYHTSPPGSWTEFDALWAPYTWDDFDRTPTATTNAQIQEGM